MKNNKYISIKYNFQVMILTFCCIFILSLPAGASEVKELSFKEAIQWGIEKNHDLQMIRNSINELERNLKILDASESIQTDLSVTPIWHFGYKEGDIEEGEVVELGEKSFTTAAQVNLKSTKKLIGDINLSSEFTWESEDLNQEGNFEEILSQINANLKLEKNIYPGSWAENEKQAYSIKNNLQKRLEELRWEEMEKQIEFIRDYLDIIRLQEQVDIAEERMVLAEEELSRVRRKITLGEGGYQQETEAKIALEEAKNQLFNQEKNLSRSKKQFSLLLNLSEDVAIEFERNVDFIQGLFSRMNIMEIDHEIQANLIDEILEKNYQIKNNQLEKDELIKELEWTEDEGKPKVNLAGGYQLPANWFVMVDFSVKLADGGVQELKEEQKQDNIRQKENAITYLKEQLKLEAEQLLDQDQYNQLHWDTQLLALEKEQSRAEIMEKQYQQGAISEIQWKSEILTLQEKEINVKLAKDEWLVNRLQLAHFIGSLEEEL
jgi:outer membrane protein TolC